VSRATWFRHAQYRAQPTIRIPKYVPEGSPNDSDDSDSSGENMELDEEERDGGVDKQREDLEWYDDVDGQEMQPVSSNFLSLLG
jgi:hypothetical protein